MRYRTIVADPPWDHSDGTGWNWGTKKLGDPKHGYGHGPTVKTKPPYEHMTINEIGALPIDLLAEDDAHLYLWTTQRYLHDSFNLIHGWGFTVKATLVWCKPNNGFFGGAWRSNVEFVQFATRGSLKPLSQAPSRWHAWPRTGRCVGAGERTSVGHSQKPEAFLDLVEQVSPGPYVELFARRARFGWDYWGDESLSTVEMPA